MSGEDRIEEAAREIAGEPRHDGECYVYNGPGARSGHKCNCGGEKWRDAVIEEAIPILQRLYDDGKKAGAEEEKARWDSIGCGGSYVTLGPAPSAHPCGRPLLHRGSCGPRRTADV